jgi:putative DNA primase/helicase
MSSTTSGFKRSGKQTAGGTAGAAASTNGTLPVVVFPPLNKRPRFVVYETEFQVKGHRYKAGVYHHTFTKETDPQTKAVQTIEHDTWILSVLKVVAIIRAESGKEHGYLIEYVAHGESSRRREVLSQSSLLGRAEESLKVLRDMGVSALYQHARAIREYLDTQHLRFNAGTPADFWRSVKVVGWAPAPTCFVLPTEIIGQQNGVWFNGRGDVAEYGKKGKMAEWKDEVAQKCVGNDYLILAASCAFAGPLLELLNIPGLALHYFGDSTTGKSSALAVAGSAWGPPKFMLSWRSTVNGLESQAASRSGTLAPLDESHMIEAKHLDAGIYMLLNGVAKARMNRDASARDVVRWRVCVLSTGERSLESNLTAASIDHKAGQGVRIVDVPVTGAFGLFDDLHQEVSGSVFADSLRDAAGEYYGHAGPLFVSQLIKEASKLSLPSMLAGSLKGFGDGLNPQESRVARSFAVIALAGELAIKWSILPWNHKIAWDAAVRIFKHWRATQLASTKSREHAQILERISDFLDSHSDSRFSDLNWVPITNTYGNVTNEEPMIRNRLGYWDDSGSSRLYLFTSGGLREATKGFDFNRAIKALDEADAFTEKGADGRRARSWRVPDGRVIKMYAIDPAKL